MREKISYHPMGLLIICSIIITVAYMFISCQKMPRITSPGEKLIRQAVEATGGVKKATDWDTRVEKGLLKVNWPGWGHLTANCSRYVKKPYHAKIDNDFTAYDHPFYMTYYCDADTAWSVVNMNVRQSSRISSFMKEFIEKANGLAYYLSHSDTFLTVMDVPEDSLIDVSSVERAGVVMEGDTILFDIHSETHLLTRMIDEGGQRQTIYMGYRKTSGPKVPFRVTVYQNGKKVEERIWKEIKFDQEIDPAIFREDKPSDD
jgi:hypothetical protein